MSVLSILWPPIAFVPSRKRKPSLAGEQLASAATRSLCLAPRRRARGGPAVNHGLISCEAPLAAGGAVSRRARGELSLNHSLSGHPINGPCRFRLSRGADAPGRLIDAQVIP